MLPVLGSMGVDVYVDGLGGMTGGTDVAWFVAGRNDCDVALMVVAGLGGVED